MPKVPGFQASKTTWLKSSQTSFPHPTNIYGQNGTKYTVGRGAKTKHNGREVQVQGQEAVEGGASDQSWGLLGGYTGGYVAS